MKATWTNAVRVLMAMLMGFLVLGPLFQEARAQKAPVVIPAGTVIPVKIEESVSGKTHMMGSTVRASVARDITINNIIVIKLGTPVEVTVAQAEKAGMVGQAGAVNLTMESTTAVDGQSVFIRGGGGSEGQSSTGAAVGAGVVLCPLFLMMKGKEGFIPAGTEMMTRSLSAVNVQVPE